MDVDWQSAAAVLAMIVGAVVAVGIIVSLFAGAIR